MVTLQLDEKDLINILKGVSLSYEQMELPFVKANGRFNGSHGTWSWSYSAFEKYSEEELVNFYLILKES